MKRIWLIKRCILFLTAIIYLAVLGADSEAMNGIDKDIAKVELDIRYLKLEKEDTNKEPLPLKSDQGDFSDSWVRKKAKEVIRQYSMKREMRIDFKLKNIYFKNPSIDKEGKFEYPIFSVKWPIFSMEIINKKLKRGMYQTYAWISSKNSQVLVEGLGYYFLQNQLISDWYGDESKAHEVYRTENIIVKILDQKNTLQSVLKNSEKFPEDKPYNIEGYCVYGGSLVSAQRGSLWYPFDMYSSKLYIDFPYQHTDLNLSVEQSADFDIKIKSAKEKELENFKLEKGKELLIEILLKRKNYRIYYGVFLSIVLLLLPKFIPKQGDIILARLLAYVGAFCSIWFATIPPENIPALFPIRFGLLSLTGICVLINEYLYYLRNLINR